MVQSPCCLDLHKNLCLLQPISQQIWLALGRLLFVQIKLNCQEHLQTEKSKVGCTKQVKIGLKSGEMPAGAYNIFLTLAHVLPTHILICPPFFCPHSHTHSPFTDSFTFSSPRIFSSQHSNSRTQIYLRHTLCSPHTSTHAFLSAKCSDCRWRVADDAVILCCEKPLGLVSWELW